MSVIQNQLYWNFRITGVWSALPECRDSCYFGYLCITVLRKTAAVAVADCCFAAFGGSAVETGVVVSLSCAV